MNKICYRHLQHYALDEYTKVLLHFDNEQEPFKDECGNIWTPSGSPTISESHAKFGKALQLDGESYLQMNETITLGGQDFTIDGQMYITNMSETPRIISISKIYDPTFQDIVLYNYGSTANWSLGIGDSDNASGLRIDAGKENFANKLTHFAIVYIESTGTFYLYFNGVKKASVVKRFDERSNLIVRIGSKIVSSGNFGYTKGAIDEFRISDGIARWTEDFEVPTAPYQPEEHYQLDVDKIKLYRKKMTNPSVVVNRQIGKLYAGLVPLEIQEKIITDVIENDTSTIALLHFDESTTKDECGNEWQSTGNLTLTTGKFDKALNLNNATLYLENVDLTGDFTIEFGAYINNGSGTFLKFSDSYALEFDGTLNWEIIGLQATVTYNGIGNRTWHHIAIVKKDSTMNIYLNGILTAMETLPSEIYNLTFGGGDFLIDELRISNCARYSENFNPPTQPFELDFDYEYGYETIQNQLASHLMINHEGEVLAIAKSKKTATATYSSSGSIVLHTKKLTETIAVSTESDGEISARLSDYSVAEVSVTGNNVVVTALTTGTITLYIKIGEGTEYEETTYDEAGLDKSELWKIGKSRNFTNGVSMQNAFQVFPIAA